jgi:hypothetical protein
LARDIFSAFVSESSVAEKRALHAVSLVASYG